MIIEINDAPVLNALNRLLNAGNEMHPLLNAIGAELETRTRSRFETKTDPSGAQWPAWAPSTLKQYDRADTVKGKGGKNEVRRKGSLLDREGHMLDSLSYQADENSVMVGFGEPYAKYHEFGTSRMPRRGMLTADPNTGTLGAEDEQSILDILNNYLQSAID